jgi:ubiquinone/menaquinone biosynthesis C-methylase UbiE
MGCEGHLAKKVKQKFGRFIERAEREVLFRPWLVVILMHEYYRNLYPTDPYLPFDPRVSPFERVSSVLDCCLQSLEAASSLGSYFEKDNSIMGKLNSSHLVEDKDRSQEETTQQVYGHLWDKLNIDDYVKEAANIIKTRLRVSDFDLSSLKGKTVLDIGCGSGRFSIALALTGAKKVHGIDLGRKSIEQATQIANAVGINNIQFEVGDILDLPYQDGQFDFVYCNGVLHHTKNMEKGIEELYRILKPGSRAFLYLYADGGLFWHSRKKMPQVMKKIPQKYTMGVLDLIGTPHNRFIFCDNWYVPIERHVSREYLESLLRKVGFAKFKKVISGRETDLDSIVASAIPQATEMWGEGEHRYLITK